MVNKILITGAAGFVASHLIATLSHEDVEIVGVDDINEYGNNVRMKYDRLRSLGFMVQDVSYGERLRSHRFPSVSFIRLSVADQQNVNRLFQEESFDYVVHLAAQAGVRQGDIPQSVYHQSNIIGFQTIIEACHRHAIKKFVFASSSSVYGNGMNVPQKETAECGSLCSFYAETKKANEEIAFRYSTEYHLPCIGFRFFSVYGPWGRPDMLPMKVANHIMHGEPLTIYNNGNYKRDFTYVGDVVEAIVRAIDYSFSAHVIPYKVYNVGNGHPISIHEFIRVMEHVFGKPALPRYTDDCPKEDVTQTWADSTLLQKDLGVCPHWSLEQGLERFAQWYKAYDNSRIVISLLTTRNRDSFYAALRSVGEQKRQPDGIVVVSDSTEDRIEKEQAATENVMGVYLRGGINAHTHNYAGSLNIGIDYIINEWVINKKVDPSRIYIATLDDDDIWMPEYLEECCQVLETDTDFVVSGLIYHKKEQIENLSIPEQLTIHSFLRGNPHIQGSNTFVRLSILLQAGCFDESMPSTTDRDIFVRIMQQSPCYAVVPKPLVHIYTQGERITSNKEKKAEGLRHFYRKYRGLMSPEDEEQFHRRNSSYFGIEKEDLFPLSIEQPVASAEIMPRNRETYNGCILIGCIVTYQAGAKRLLQEIPTFVGGDYQIVLLNNTGADLSWLAHLPNAEREHIQVLDAKHKHGSIAENRQQLQEYLYSIWPDKPCVCWVLDDDMQLKQIASDYQEYSLFIRQEIPDYLDKYDAVVGGYTNDAPLPLLSTLRLALLDYTYSQAIEADYNEQWIQQTNDYYYALTDSGYTHIEAPLFASGKTIDAIFQGEMTRPLINRCTAISEATNRGGNTLVLNRELLLLPTCSLQIRDIKARRGDYLWALMAKQEGYNICQGTFCTFHNREKKHFDYADEIDKMLRDIIGSSMTKAIEKEVLSMQDWDGKKRIVRAYINELQKRLVRFVDNYYRIKGLLHIIGEAAHCYAADFTDENLNYFLKKREEYNQPAPIETAFRGLLRKIDLTKNSSHQQEYLLLLSQHLHVSTDELICLGFGNEGCVFRWNNQVYKVLYDTKADISLLRNFAPIIAEFPMFYTLRFEQENEHTILSYHYEASQPMRNVKASDFSRMLLFGKEHGFVLTNIKPENFIQTETGLKYIDYGRDIVPFTEEDYQKSIERAFQAFRYYFLSDLEFKEIITQSYHQTADAINSGLDIFKKMLIPTYKEQIHDPSVIQAIRDLNPHRVLDYGAGKCKIANQLVSNDCAVDVFDINTAILHERAGEGICIIEDERQIPQHIYDVVNCNQVLCWVDDALAEHILHNITQALKPEGHLFVSICDPFFTDIQHTMLRGGGRQEPYYNTHTFQEYTATGKAIDGMEHHRPIDWYCYQLQRFGLQIVNTWETNGINTDTALSIGEHLVLVCRKTEEYRVLNDTTLLIKACAMDHEYIYENIQHIVSQLEQGCMFAERVVVVDVARTEANHSATRLRAYCDDNQAHLLQELRRAKDNGWIDRIILPESQDQSKVFTHYFQEQATNAHALNGQPIFATLYAFMHIATPYVYQTDCDILYTTHPGTLLSLYNQFIEKTILTLAPSIHHKQKEADTEGHRLEVRTCFLNLALLETLLPLSNPIEGEYYSLPWHRCIDQRIQNQPILSLRSGNPAFAFVHPTNEQKKDHDLIASVRFAMEKALIPSCQAERVDLYGDRGEWLPTTEAPIVVVSRGKNTSSEKVKRMLDSLCEQDMTFDMIYTDAHSTNTSEQYTSFLFKHHPDFRRAIYIPNQTDKKEIELLLTAIQQIQNPNALVVLVDNDDYLLRKDALSILWKQYQLGHDYICGNCIRYDKPNKHYQVSGFDQLWNRNGDNIWIHPICFQRELFDQINLTDLQADDEFINICTDFAYATPLVQVAKNPCYQPIPIYYFEPSLANQLKEGKYNQQIVNQTRDYILKKAKERYETNRSRYRR